ncbi:helix-turn-helix transcriptional regulator [Pseudomonas syringae group genomosp. 3]|uniref:DNA-binding protein n=1 Tax=Pseudomonas syringae pv. viburni TaxID=251703 RepID=A0A0Q0CR16_9PSED|nr:DNA-binding protein [Pseudomonas syringae pv. viburni]
MRQNEEFGVKKESKKGAGVLISKKQLLAIIPLCERTIYNFEKQGKFPRRIALSSRKVVWDLAEIEAWIDSCKEFGKAHRPGMGA